MGPRRRAVLVWMCLSWGCGARTSLRVPEADAAPDAETSPDVVIPPNCGDGVLDLGEACDDGAENGDVPAFAVSQAGRATSSVRPLASRADVATFYAYRSASAHTGFELVGVALQMLTVDARDGVLGLVFTAGRDDDLGGASQPDGEMSAQFSGVPVGVTMALADESGECTLTGAGVYRGQWRFQGNTDGAAFRGFPWDIAWRVVVSPTFVAGITSQRWIDGDGRPLALSTSGEVVIEHRVTSPRCRRDCTARRCGDGRLDAGERCDDGNTRDGDGCAADCQRFE